MIGIDVSKTSLSVCAWDREQVCPRWETTVPNAPEGIAALLSRCDLEEPLVLEPTGAYGELLVRLAASEGRTVFSASPLRAKQFLQGRRPRAKTDRLDARGLAEYAALTQLRLYRLREPRLQRLWELLLSRRTLSKAIAALSMQQQVLAQVQPELQALLTALRLQLKLLDRHLVQAGRHFALFEKLRTVPGVGPVTAAALTVRLTDIDFARVDSFVAYLGLDARVSDSGKKVGRRRLTKNGDSTLRWLLYLAAQASLRTKDPYFRALYDRKCQEGLPRTAAICIVARKLAKITWALSRSGESYRPERVGAIAKDAVPA